MCGICGYISRKTKLDLDTMTDVMVHRGPDGRGTYSKNFDKLNIGLGHRRLSIIDLSLAGHQPMSNEDGTVWIVYNGEIYNFLGLRTKLEKFGHEFKSNTDTEVIIHAYEEWGEKCLERFNGMFAFAIWDEKTQKLFVARDRLGVKPLYYFWDQNNFVFASEIKAILKSNLIKPVVNIRALPYYLAFLWVPGSQTMFKNIFKLPAGHCLIWQNNNIKIKQYWDIQPKDYLTLSKETIAQQLLSILRHEVKQELISDVPLGVFLSGGVDSSAIATLMTQAQTKPVDAFTIGFHPQDQKIEKQPQDITYSRILNRRLKNKLNYHEIFIKPAIANLLPRIIWHLEEPIADPAAITAYLICKVAKDNNITVMLSGMGGDEIFAGYNRHLANRLLLLFDKLHQQSLLMLFKKIFNFLPVWPALPYVATLRYLKKIAKHFSLSPEKRYIGISSWLSRDEILNLLVDKIKVQLKDLNWHDIHSSYYNKYQIDNLFKMLYTDLKTFLIDLNLTYTDKMSMATSVEVRVPLLNYKLVEFAFSIPSELKLHRFSKKYIFKKCLGNVLPETILKRKKVGFGAPIRSWLQKDLKDLVNTLLSPQQVKKRGYFNPEVVQEMIKKNMLAKEDYSYSLWALLTFEIWHQKFIDKKI